MKKLQRYTFPACLAIGLIVGLVIDNIPPCVAGGALVGIALHLFVGNLALPRDPGTYWNHNVAYHPWLIRRIRPGDRVLDVGCGDGSLLAKLTRICIGAVGVEPDAAAAELARKRLTGVGKLQVVEGDFEHFSDEKAFDVIVFAASIHHMDMESALLRAKRLLRPSGRILIVGCARPGNLGDYVVEALRVIPAKLGSLLHGERRGGDIGVPVTPPQLSLQEIRAIADRELPGARIRRGLYYRYLLEWEEAA